eukprot:2349478-Rhodomonas_salina.1
MVLSTRPDMTMRHLLACTSVSSTEPISRLCAHPSTRRRQAFQTATVSGCHSVSAGNVRRSQRFRRSCPNMSCVSAPVVVSNGPHFRTEGRG